MTLPGKSNKTFQIKLDKDYFPKQNKMKKEYYYSLTYYTTSKDGRLTGLQTIFLVNDKKLNFNSALRAIIEISKEQIPTIVSINPLSKTEYKGLEEIYNELKEEQEVEA